MPAWQDVHVKSTLLDMHAHPSFYVSLFNRAITRRFYPSRSAFDPFSVRTNVPTLQKGSVDVLLSAVYAPERGIFDECRYLRILRFFLSATWKKIYGRPYFDVTSQMLDEIENAIAAARDPVQPYADFCRAVHLDRGVPGVGHGANAVLSWRNTCAASDDDGFQDPQRK